MKSQPADMPSGQALACILPCATRIIGAKDPIDCPRQDNPLTCDDTRNVMILKPSHNLAPFSTLTFADHQALFCCKQKFDHDSLLWRTP